MKKNEPFLNPILEENKNKVFIGDRYNPISAEDSERYNDVVESPEYAEAYKKLVERVIPTIDVKDPSTWAFYGSAEKYYRDAFEYIHDSYPYDGSALEKINWSLSASAIDLAVLQHQYPLETGHIGFSTSSWGARSGAKSGIYGLSDSLEYIKFSGGPYVGTVIDASTRRESSLKIEPALGNTVEFWLKKDAFVDASKTESEIVFDSHTVDFGEGNAAYGRFLLELSASSGSPIYVTYMSGTAGANRRQIGQNITTSNIADNQFHHYAITALHTGSNLEIELYVDGAFNDSISIGAASMGPINGYFNASLGALRTTKDGNGGLGYGKLKGSIDEFRFWKTKRTAEEIGNYFDFPVHGATDNEKINSLLGIYFKFNEGIHGSDAKDKVVIDYSGRLNNGEFIGYTSQARSRLSAITLSSQTSQSESGDPILVPTSPTVQASLEELVKIGKAYDELNNSSLMKSVPQWAYDTSAGSSNIDSNFSVLLQIIGQQFDSIRMLIDGLPKIGFTQYKDFAYSKGTADYSGNTQFQCLLGCEKDFSIEFSQMFGEENFSAQNLLSKGMTLPVSPIVDKASLNEYFYNLKFDITDSKTNLSQALIHSKAEDIKNKILNSLHANISHIYKKKGTKDSFRNIIRCFGVDENLVIPNMYAQNVENFIKNEPVYDAIAIKSLTLTGSNSETTLYQTAAASDERAYITGSASPASITLESRIIFPNLEGQTGLSVTSSVFGMNQVSGSDLVITNPNYAGIRVKTIKSRLSNTGCRFSISSSASIFNTLTTDYFNQVYANTPWYLAVRFTEDTGTPLINSDNKSTQSYKVDFIGYRYDQDIKTSEFHLTASITQANFQSFMSANKSVFLGADKENIIGSLQNSTDIRALSLTAWNDHLTNKEMQEHAKSVDNIGRTNPLHALRGNQGQSRRASDSMIFNWVFDDVQQTDATTNYIYDNASGSLLNVARSGDILGYKYPAVTHNLQHQGGSVQREHLATLKYLPVDNLESKSRVEIKDREIEKFEISSRPISYMHAYEKSMYQIISQEMLKMLAGVEAFNTLIGEPVYKYRQDYKSLEKLRDRFFAKVENEIDFERFVEYYKWIDKSLSGVLEQFQPATAAMNIGLEDVVESHAFERNKYKHQAPQLEYKEPNIVGQILGINELLYDWEHGHAPLPGYWASFDGTDDFIEVADHNDFSFGDATSDSAFSLSAWVVFDNPVSSGQTVIGKYNANTASEYLLFNNNGYLQINLYDVNTTNRIQSKTNSVVFESGRLYHIAMTYDGSADASGITLYIDGIEPPQTKTSSGTYTAMHNTATAVRLGSTVAGSLDFARNMHHVMVLSNELPAAQVSQLNSLYSAGTLNVSAETFASFGQIISWWKMDKQSLDIDAAVDSVGSHNGTFSGDAHIATEYGIFKKQNINCLWWSDRAERDKILSEADTATNADKEELRVRRNTIVSGSTYVLRKLSRPYKFSVDNQRVFNLGSNRKANKNKALYKPIIASGQEIQINSSDIYQFKQCDDVVDPQKEKIYTAKTNTTGTDGYLDADADMILPLSLYSSSAGKDFSQFKANLQITNNHDDDIGILQSPYLRELVGGMPHRRVKFGTPDADRPEAYILSASSTTLTLKQHTGPKSYTTRGSGVTSGYSIANIKTDTISSPAVLGNYTHDYDIVMTNGRNINNSYLIESGSILITPISEGYVAGMVDFTSPARGRTEHVIVNQFNSPGAPETQGVYGRDKESGEYSIYNTLNYRNLSIRQPLDKLSKEYSGQFGHREDRSALLQAATATITSTALASVDNTITLVAFDGTTVTYTAKAATNTSNNQFRVSYSSGTPAAQLQNSLGALKTCIEHSSGHNGKILVTQEGSVLTLTQARPGLDGHTDISHTLDNAVVSSKFDFLSIPSLHMTNRNHFYSVISGSDGDVYGKQIKADNFFVQHPIPQNDLQYSWITASATSNKFDFVKANNGFGHQHLFNSSSAKAIQFVSASIYGSWIWDQSGTDYDGRIFGLEKETTESNVVAGSFVPVDLVGLNTIIHEPINTGSNIMGQDLSISSSIGVNYIADNNYVNQSFVSGFPAESGAFTTGSEESWNYVAHNSLGGSSRISSTLNSIILNRQGPYGWPTWKQIRGGEHPIVRAHKKTNTFSRVFLGDPIIGADSIIRSSNTPSMNLAAQIHGNISLDAYERARALDAEPSATKSRMVKNYVEPKVLNKFDPITITIHAGVLGAANRQRLEYNPGDNLSLPHFFQEKRENQPRLTQQLRESLWKKDGKFYQELNIPAAKVTTDTLTFQNDLNVFTNEELIRDIEYMERKYHRTLDVISEVYIGNENANNHPLELSFSETIYPRELNTFMKNSRDRVNFDYFPWKSTREKRNIQLSGNIVHNLDNTMLFLDNAGTGFHAFSEFVSRNADDYKKSIFGKFDALKLQRLSAASDIKIPHLHLSMSSWPLDARKEFTEKPVNIHYSFMNDGNKFLTSSIGSPGCQESRGPGLLQNNFSTFPLGINNLYGTPPISMVYNRRIPQPYGAAASYLSGEAKWEAADNTRGPFYDSYSEYSEEIVNVAPDHSIIPEFRMSEFVEDVINKQKGYPFIGDDFLNLTGAIYQNSSGDVSIGGNFFKTYSNSDFLKYFSSYDENTAGGEGRLFDLKHGRINFKCKAAMKFLPYKGFYPAERAVEISKLFHDNYLPDSLIDAARIRALEDSPLSTAQARRYAKLRANASRYQSSKPFFGPGVLFNSIKAGVAVDYPIFSGSFESVYDNLHATTLLNDFSTISMPTTNLFTGSIINSTKDNGIPRLRSSVLKRIEFEDFISPANIFGDDIYDNEPHPSASLIYGNQHWHKIIERPAKFGNFDTEDAQSRLGINFTNTARGFSRQMSAYTMASQNFAAETVNFFLEDGHLTTAISKPIRERFEAGTYKMRVYFTNADTVMYDRASAFGPPVDDGAGGVSLTKYSKVVSDATGANFRLTFNDIDGSGGTVAYNLNNVTASHNLPQLIFVDESSNIVNVFLYNEDHYSVPGTPDFTSGAIKIYNASNSDRATIMQRTVRNADQVVMINVKNSLGTATALNIKTAFDNSNITFNATVNRAGAVLAITSSTTGPLSNFAYYESPASNAVEGGLILGTQFLREGSIAITGSFKDGTNGLEPLFGNVYSEVHANGIIDIITDGVSAQNTSFTTSTVSSTIEHGFAPYVPPFLDPGAEPYVEVSFTTSNAGVFGAQEIIEKSTFEYYNFHTAPSNAGSNTNYKESMSLSASLNLGICATLRTDNLEQIEGHGGGANDGNFNLRDVDPNNLLQRWVIQTKWETPVMDFSQVTASAYNLTDDSITQVSGSPWKTRYWDSYYDRGLPIAGATSGIFLTGSTGMWHQKGDVLDESDTRGYFLTIKDVKQDNGAPGLAEKLGFNISEEPSVGALKRAKKYRSRVGLVEDRKVVKEAIVAIPYVIREDLDNRVEFIRLSNAYYEIARQNVEEIKNVMKTTPLTDRILTIDNYNRFRAQMDFETKTPVSDAPIDAIEYQLFMMDEYILPPQLDFTRVPRDANAVNIPEPFMMYFFQFHASFNREDLTNIWQNLYPVSPGSTASPRYSYASEELLGRIRPHNDISYVSHYLETVELTGVSLAPVDNVRALFAPSDKNKTRWLIFKVKQRGENSLEKIRRRSIDPREENVESVQYLAAAKSAENSLTLPGNLPGRREDGTMDLQFNWPYDYFSFVELIRLDAKIDAFNYEEQD